MRLFGHNADIFATLETFMEFKQKLGHDERMHGKDNSKYIVPLPTKAHQMQKTIKIHSYRN